MKVKTVLRFWIGGRLVEPGEEVEVDESLGREIIASGKAVSLDSEPAPAPEALIETAAPDSDQ